eukprot:SM000022S07205  [mRNA]  locus=s22:582558:584563:+ [translate_table: standard]
MPGRALGVGRAPSSHPPARAAFELLPPPYALDALEPHLSEETLNVHWGRHHRTYVDNLNKQTAGTDLERTELEEVVRITYNRGNPRPEFNNAGQAWNHQFYWESMKPGGGGKPTGELLELIERDFGSYASFLEEFKKAGLTQFGSGWAWLAAKDGKLLVDKTPNALSPLQLNQYPLLTMDVWEHAYYIDYQNDRARYIETFLEHLVSWDTVTDRLEHAKASTNFHEPDVPTPDD